MKKSVKATAIILTVMLILAGCSGGDSGAAAGNNQGNGANVDSKRIDIVVGMSGEPVSVEPQSCYDAAGAKIVCNVYDGLVDVDDNNEIMPNLAEKWSISDDGTVYTFNLRTDVKFHNGDSLKASDVKYSIDKACELGFGEETTGLIKETNVVDDNTVEVVLKSPYKPMIHNFAESKYLYVVNEKLAREAGDNFAISPVGAGTGPYKFVGWETGVNIKLAANEAYHRGVPAIKDVTFKFIPETSAGAIALETGDVDVYTDLSFVDVPNLQQNSNLQVDITLGRYVHYLCMNQLKEPYDNPLVRKAIAYSINADEFILAVLNGIGGEKTGNVVFPQTFGYSADCPPIEQDIEKAKSLLAEAGYPDGLTCKMLATDGARKKGAETLQGMFAKAGIDLQIEVLEFSAMVDKQVNSEHEIIIMNSSAPIMDADAELTDKICTGSWGNFSRYSNEAVDKLMQEARIELDDSVRQDKYKEIQRILYEELPIIPLYYAKVASGAKAGLKGFRAWGNTYIYLREMSW